MARLPFTLVQPSTTGLIVLAFGENFHVADCAGRVVASTSDGLEGDIAKIGSPGKGSIGAVTFSRNGSLLAACTSEKSVTIYATSSWDVVRTQTAEKRVNALAFDPQGEYLLIADKSGDVYRVPTTAEDSSSTQTEEKPEPLLGHVSILCDIKFSFGKRPYVLTCDRDEKLRISKYPNSYNIEAFGLGHKEFVTSVATMQAEPSIAATGSGDGTVRLWEITSGRLLQTVQLQDLLAKYYADGRAVCGKDTFEDRTTSTERYGVLRVRAVESQRLFVVVVERIPSLVVLPLIDGPAFGNAKTIDIAFPPTDVGVLDNRIIVTYAPPTAGEASGDNDLAIALSCSGSNNEIAIDKMLTNALNSIVTTQVDSVPKIPSIFVWGNKMYLERPKGEEEE
ncbi:hypothetical protein H4R20_006549 [Coemansia guatemalensis]|uniref:tRNA (guanine-N(7)-)-methyltransferase non-catalytic subunit TRM82 n=1 Tax=Coemansia guatemalensis TaxID=2761395 RepID=A0A9W8HQL9_9FUNG|nr:hypothetical protein H4R20_006549 [Coemansia guatemalensis]